LGVTPSSTTSFGALCALAARQQGVVARSQLAEQGVSAQVVRRLVSKGFLTKLAADTFAVGGPPDTWHRRLMVGTLQLGPTALVSGRAAAALHGFDTFRPGALEFLIRQDVRVTLGVGTVHRSAMIDNGLDRAMVLGIPCSSATRTVFDLASVIGARRLEHVIDSGLRDAAFTEDELVDVLVRLRRSGRPGVRRLEEALSVVADGPVATSVLERRFLTLLREAGLPLPEGQVVVKDRSGRFVARVDFKFPGTPVIVELEGHRYHSTRGQRRRDHERRNALEALGNHVVVLTYEGVRDDGPGTIAQVRHALAPYRPRLGAERRSA
jgi:Transcriptional regulator, AbiEi antitoxin N-terminal domain